MKRYYLSVARIISFWILFIILFLILICAVPDQFDRSFQRAIVRQYDYLKSIKDNKIVFIGSSSLSFGLDIDLMTELTGMPCAVLGNHYGDGLLFQLEISKAALKKGDTVVIEYMNFDLVSAEGELLLSSVGKRYDMHRFYPKEMLKQILASYPGYFLKNLNYWRAWGYDPEEPYCISVYDEKGNMVAYRGECWIPEKYTLEVEEKYKYADFESFAGNINLPFINRLNEYIKYCNERGIKVYFTLPCYYEAAIHNAEYMEMYNDKLSSQLDAPLISRSVDYVFPREYIYDSIAHCNTEGAKYRTELIFQDLQPYL